MDSNRDDKFTVYYDGLCPVCSKEIDLYRKKDEKRMIRFVDISSSMFNPEEEGLKGRDFHKVFHVKDPNKGFITGVDGFVAIWDRLEIFRGLSFLAKARVTRPIFDLGYHAFTYVRPLLRSKEVCETGYCRSKKAEL